MAYGDNVLGANHRWSFNNTLNDSIGSLTVTNTGCVLIATPITRDATHSLQTNGRDDLAVVPTTTDTGSIGADRYAFQGWFMVSQIQGPPCMIYKQGGNTAGFALFLWAGNNVMLQVKDVNANNNLQIFSDIALTNNRPYHFFVRYSGSGFSNEVEFYIDGVKQTLNRNGVIPGAASITAHTGNHNWGEPGTSGTEVNTGDETVLIKASVNSFNAEYWTWFGVAAESITLTQIKDDLFGAGAIPDITITSDTESNMQAQLNSIANSSRPDVPLAILIEEVSGGGDLNLSLDNVTFNSRGSIDVRYEGSGTLNLTNTNGSNASKTSGNVNIINRFNLTLTGVESSTKIIIFEAGTQNILAQENSLIGNVFGPVELPNGNIDIRFLSLNFEIDKLENIPLTSDLSIELAQFFDRQYENL